MTSSALERYRGKRRAGGTTEPFGARTPGGLGLFVVHHHLASREHYDLRFEVDGTLWSWAVPKGPSPDPADKRFAIPTEPHPLDYFWFEDRIPEGNYGAGAMIVWDRGRCTHRIDPVAGIEDGKLLFELSGFKLQGLWTLVQTKQGWLLMKERDANATTGVELPMDSVVSGLTARELKEGHRKPAQLLRACRRAGATSPAPGPVAPMLCRPAEPFSRSGWLFEPKFDGYRIVLRRSGEDVSLTTRNGRDISGNFPELARAARELPHTDFQIDGELVVADAAGLPSFSRLQQRAHIARPTDIERASLLLPARLHVFDFLACGDHDLRDLPLTKRKRLLRRLLPSTGTLAWVDHVERVGEALFEQAVAMQLEGIVGKRMESPYRSGRSDDWLKIPALATAEFAVIGYAPERSGAGLGSLRLASLHEGRWVGVGRVAASLDEETRSALLERLESLVDDPVLDADQSDLVSVRPELVVEVRFKAWTENGHLRQPVLLHVRDDREPTSCRSGPWSNDAVDPVTVAPAPSPERVLVTNRDKVFWPECATTKGQLVDYYRAIAPRMLPYLRDRPVVLTRYPDGIDGKSFYQHRAPDFLPDWIRREAIWNEGDAEEREYIIIEDADTLAYVANLGAIPIHLWSARAGNLQRPDWCVLDLDPKEAPFRDVVTVARCLRDVLEEAQIAGFLKTTGSSGLHVLVPLAGTLTHDQARDLGELLARICVHRLPGLATIQRRVELREGRVYVDFLQNGHGKTIAAPYSVRPLPGAPLSLPLRWSDLKARLSPRRYHMGNIARRLAAVPEDPMAPLLDATFDPAAALGALAALG